MPSSADLRLSLIHILRVEGIFADRYQIATSKKEKDGQTILQIQFDGDTLFFANDGSSYLLKRRLFLNSYCAVVLRVPESVRVTTSGSPYLVSYSENAFFANRSYYENEEWRAQQKQEQEESRAIEQRIEIQREKYFVMRASFVSDLDTALGRRLKEENPSLNALSLIHISAANAMGF